MAQKLFVIMGNDFPSAICSTKEKVEAYVANKRSQTPRIYWREYDFWLDGKKPTESEGDQPGVWIIKRHTAPGDSHIVNCFPDEDSARAEAKRMNENDGPGYNNVEAVFLPFGKIGDGQ